jgi:Plant protein of unknown function
MVSIGPYHHGNKKLKAMEERKWWSLRNIIGNDVAKYFQAVRACESKALDCYNESVRMASTEFVTMLLLDACFIIDYFEKLSSQNVDTIYNVGWANIHLYSDLFLLENQIPFFVIHELITIRMGRHNCSKCPDDLLQIFCKPLRRIFSTTPLTHPEIPCDQIDHLLQLYYISMVPLKYITMVPHHYRSVHMRNDSTEIANISCVSELREAGITFKKKIEKDMFAISFNNGIMYMPVIKIEDTHKVILWNMVAFEQSKLHSYKSQILSSYLALMDSLINTEKDVTILQRRGIVENYLQSNEDAAELFNQFAKSFVLDYSNHYYQDLFQEVNRYSNSTWHKNRARLKHDYFRNPWTTISVLAAAMLLILTAFQTYFSGKSAKWFQ